VIRWESVLVLLRHHLVADPHRELAAATLDQFRIDSSLLLDQRRRTGSARTIVSDPAKSNADALHAIDSVDASTGPLRTGPSTNASIRAREAPEPLASVPSL
jgi:hypothetical protein